MTTNGLRIILAEDDLLLRAGLASLLERSEFQVVGQAGDALAFQDDGDADHDQHEFDECWA
jgi:serine/threonine-protein kinase PknK